MAEDVALGLRQYRLKTKGPRTLNSLLPGGRLVQLLPVTIRASMPGYNAPIKWSRRSEAEPLLNCVMIPVVPVSPSDS